MGVPWIRLDSKSPSHPKVSALDDAHFRFWMEALCYSGDHATHGLITHGWVTNVARRPIEYAEHLVDVGLMERDIDDFLIHDWFDHQPRPEYFEQKSAAGRLGAKNRWDKDREATAKAAIDADDDGTRHDARHDARDDTRDDTRHAFANATNTNTNTNTKTDRSSDPTPLSGKPSPAGVLGVWNEVFGKKMTPKMTPKGWGRKIAACINAHPELTLDDHRQLIEREHASPWWDQSRPVSPALQYGSVAQFERCLSRGEATPALSPGAQALQRLAAERADDEGPE